MDTISSEKIIAIEDKIKRLQTELDALKIELQSLKADDAPTEEPIDIDFSPFDLDDEPEPTSLSEDMPEDLFGMGSADTPRAAIAPKRRPKSVLDVMSDKAAWRTDMPGPEVRSLRSAIALGDQVVFINRLFRKDSSLYQSTLDTLNNTPTLAEAIRFLSATFPEWDLESDDVYRFMMAVRRKIRR